MSVNQKQGRMNSIVMGREVRGESQAEGAAGPNAMRDNLASSRRQTFEVSVARQLRGKTRKG